MKVIVDVCLVPIGVGTSLSPYIAECKRIFESAGLTHRVHAYGTNVEGDWAVVFNAIEQCHRSVHEMGAPRITTTIKLGTRMDRSQSMEEKVSSVLNAALS